MAEDPPPPAAAPLGRKVALAALATGAVVVTIARLAGWLAWAATRLGHYTSTYCLHGNHPSCRLTCKLCQAPCQCRCHAGRF